MRNIGKIFISDVRRISKNVVAVVVIMGLSVIPSLYAWFNIFSNWDPYGEEATSNLKIAVFSEDKGTDIIGIDVNIGSTVVETLEENRTIGWVFTESANAAIDGVYSGDYYAAIVIPEDFTGDMISFLGGEIEHPDIIYYENEKKNAIAPKITQKARTSVQEELNATFVSTLAEVIVEIGGELAGENVEGSSPADTVMVRLNELGEDLQSYINILNSFSGIMSSAKSIVETSQVMLPGLDSMVASGQNTISGMESLMISGNATADTVSQMVSYSFDMVRNSLDGVMVMAENDLNRMENYESSAVSGTAAPGAVLPYLKELFENAVGVWENTADIETQRQIQEIRDGLDRIETNLNSLSESGTAASGEVSALRTQIETEIAGCLNTLSSLEAAFEHSVMPELESTMNAVQNSMVAAGSVLNGIDTDFEDVENVLNSYGETLDQGSANLAQSIVMAQDLYSRLAEVIADFTALQQDEQYQQIMEILETDPSMLGSFISSPVNLDTVGIYTIENYGSAMAPFYTILAIWVGALILVAIIHVKVEPEQGIDNIKPYQAFFGRYITFFLIGQAQTLITVLGDLFYIRIQCHNPFLFWLAAAISSLVFTLLIYALTVAFGNVGEALAIIVMVIQVAGAGGTFPIETLPEVYRSVYKYLPFPYGMNAMRETIGGMYGMDYWNDIGMLGLYIVIALFIGLVLAIPFRKLNRIIEKSKENTGIMI